LLDEVSFLFGKLLIVCAVGLEARQEVHQLGLILQQDIQNRLWFAWIRDKHLRRTRTVGQKLNEKGSQ